MTPTGDQPIGSIHRLPARWFYGLIVGGVVLGLTGCVAAGWFYLEYGGRQPSGRRVWDGLASEFVIPVCAMIGSTFGGLAGVMAAMVCDSWHSIRSRHSGAG